MVGQWRDSGPPLLEELNPQQARGDAAAPDTDNADKNDEGTRKGKTFIPWRPAGRQVGSAKPFLATFLVLLLLEAQYNVSSRLRSYLKAPQIPLDDVSMHKYLDDFNKAAGAMKEAWESSKSPVQQAFQKHFTPSLEDAKEPPEDPLATISDHVAKMRECKIPSDSVVEARRDFALHLQLLRDICRTVTLRLEELKWFVYMNEEFDVPVPVPGHDEPYSYPDLEVVEGRVEDGLPATHFLKSVGLFGGDSTQKVDEMLTDKLIYLLAIENKHHVYDMVARYYIEHFFQPFGQDDAFHADHSTVEYKIPYNERPLRIGALAQAAASIFRESHSTMQYVNVRKMHRIADNWTPKGVLEATKQQEKENVDNFLNRLNTRREQMRRLLDEGIPKDDLVFSALFLL